MQPAIFIVFLLASGCRLFGTNEPTDRDSGIDVADMDAGNVSTDMKADIPMEDPRWTDISAGLNHACALDQRGAAWCWGDVGNNKLGTNHTLDQASPVLVETTTRFLSVHAGDSFTCGVSTDQTLWCWGDARVRGVPAGMDDPTPIQISDQRWETITAGGNHVCGIDDGGDLWCWGSNTYGQAGGVLEDEFRPVQIDLGGAVQDVGAAGDLTCGLISGTVHCFGEDPFTEETSLAPNTTYDAPEPFATLHVGDESVCGLVNGDPYCWGRADYTASPTPTKLPGTSTFTEFWLKGGRVCGRTDGRILCMGSNYRARLGNGSDEGSPGTVIPWALLATPSDLVTLSLGHDFGCGLSDEGTLECWGRNASGEIGVGAEPNLVTPTILGTFDEVELLEYSTCVRAGADVQCTGRGQYNALGNGSPIHVAELTPVEGTYDAIAAYDSHACAIPLNDTGLRCWGNPADEVFGFSDRSVQTPRSTATGFTFVFVDTNLLSTMAINANGTLVTMGASFASPGVNISPTSLGAPWDGFESVSVGREHACGIRADELLCWGEGSNGLLGQGTTADARSAPVVVPGIEPIVALASRDGTCAVTSANELFCWGSEMFGGGTVSDVPVQVDGSFQHVDASVEHIVAVTTSGDVMCWGSSGHGECGVVTTDPVVTPTVIDVFTGTYVAAYAGDDHTCAVTQTGETHCIGFQEFGRLGNGVDSIQYFPTALPPPAL